MSFENTTRKMADDVSATCAGIRAEITRLGKHARTQGSREFAAAVISLTEAVDKLARCVSRRFPRELDPELLELESKCVVGAGTAKRVIVTRPTPPARADGGVCRDCGGLTVPTGACSTCTECGTTGGCG